MGQNRKKRPQKKRLPEEYKTSHGTKSCRECGNSKRKIGLDSLCSVCRKDEEIVYEDSLGVLTQREFNTHCDNILGIRIEES